MVRHLSIFSATLLWLAGCSGSSEPPTSSIVAPTAGGQAGAGGRTPESPSVAGAGGASPFAGCGPDEGRAFAARLDANRGCLETASPEQVGCVAPPHQDGTSCLERIEDGARFWIRPWGTLRWDDAAFRPCAATPRPPACFNRQCTSVLQPASFCTPAETDEEFACGSPGSAFDAACCLRQPCEDGACPAGFHCAEILRFASHSCGLVDGACACLRTPGGQSARVCVEDED